MVFSSNIKPYEHIFDLVWHDVVLYGYENDSDIAGIFERQESTSKWHKCMLLNVSNPVAEYSTKNNATMPLEKEYTPLPEVRVLHSLSLGTETLISTGGYLLLLAWGTSFSHLGSHGIWVHSVWFNLGKR